VSAATDTNTLQDLDFIKNYLVQAGMKVNVQALDESAGINAAIGKQFRRHRLAQPPRLRPGHRVRVVALWQRDRQLRQHRQLQWLQRPEDEQGLRRRTRHQ